MIVSLSLMAVAQASAQPADAIRFYRDAYKAVAGNYRREVRRSLSSEHKEILQRITFEFSPSQDFFARAYITRGNERVVEVSFGLLAMMENLTFAYFISGEAEVPECFFSYLNSVAGKTLDNTWRRHRGQAPTMIPFFPLYVQMGGEGCENISQSDLQNPTVGRYVAGGMDSILAILLGHEIAHHLLGHLENDAVSSLEVSRRFETAADIWAVEHAFPIGVNPTPALPLWAFFAATGGSDIGDELESSHPLGIRRWAEALDIIARRMQGSDYAEQFGESIPDDVLSDFLLMRDEVWALVP